MCRGRVCISREFLPIRIWKRKHRAMRYFLLIVMTTLWTSAESTAGLAYQCRVRDGVTDGESKNAVSVTVPMTYASTPISGIKVELPLNGSVVRISFEKQDAAPRDTGAIIATARFFTKGPRGEQYGMIRATVKDPGENFSLFSMSTLKATDLGTSDERGTLELSCD